MPKTGGFSAIAFTVFVAAHTVVGADLSILNARVNNGQLEMSVSTTSSAYYVIKRGVDPAKIHGSVSVMLGTGGVLGFIDSPSRVPGEATFYRVQQFPINRPGDSDGDGMDDVFEMFHSAFLNPLSPTDAARDQDGDGRSNLVEYLAGTDITGAGPAERLPPSITLITPGVSSTITSPTAIAGSLTDSTAIYSYRVDVAPAAPAVGGGVDAPAGDWINVSRVSPNPGTKTISGPLATFDPTLLQNGEYLIRIQASDGLNSSSLVRRVQVGGNLKVGYVRLAFTDLSIPLPGLPISVTRVYDSREAGRQGDFGYGWTLGRGGKDVLETQKLVTQDLFDEVPTLSEKSRIYLTLPDGRRAGFSFVPEFISENIFTGRLFRPLFKPDPGIPFILEPLDEGSKAVAQVSVSKDGAIGLPLFFGLSLGAFDPSEYRLTGKDGTVYDYSDTEGLKRIKDPHGNVILFARDAITHSSGAKVQLHRDAQGRITRATDPDGRSIGYEYDSRGDLVSITDQAGRITRVTYTGDLAHRVQSITDTAGQVLAQASYDAQGRVTSFFDPSGKNFQESYDPTLNIGTYTDGNGNVTQLHYDDRGNIVKRVDPLGGIRQFFFNASNLATNVIDALGRSTKLTYDAQGNVTSATDPLNQTTRLEYNSFSKPISITDPLGRITRLSYDAKGELISVTDALGKSASIERDSEGRVTAFRDFNGNRTQLRYEASCACGQPSQVINPDGTTRQYEYDRYGHVTRQTDELGRVTTFSYDDVGHLLSVRDALGNVTTYGYEGNVLVRETDPLGRTKRYQYDTAGNRIREIDAMGGMAEFTYDGAGNRTSVKDPVGNVTRFVFDELNRLKEQIDPWGHKTVHRYNAVGNRVETVDRNGRKRTFEYDARDRMTRERWWNGVELVRTLDFSYDTLGNMLTASDPAATLEYSYDALSRITKAATSIVGLAKFILDYTYDAMGKVTSVQDNKGVRVGSMYDSRNRLARRTWEGAGPARLDFAYDSSGQRTNLFRFSDLSGAQHAGNTIQRFNAVGVITNITHLNAAGSTLQRYDYTRDAAQQIIHRIIDGNTSAYKYDATGQLIHALHSDMPEERFNYDANGNRIGGGYLVATNNQIVADGKFTYSYDAEGNMVSRKNTASGATTTYEYDFRNRLVAVTDRNVSGNETQTVLFTYNAMNRRIAKSVNGSVIHFQQDRENAWADGDAAGATVTRYFLGNSMDQMLARQPEFEAVNWYLTDNLETVRGIVDSNASYLTILTYASFGKPMTMPDPQTADRFRFTGREFDHETGLSFHRARFYSPHLGRFQSEDPIGFISLDSNHYRYVFNSPLVKRDPMGHQASIEYVTAVYWATAFSTVCTVGSIYSFGLSYSEALNEIYSQIVRALDFGDVHLDLNGFRAKLAGATGGVAVPCGIDLLLRLGR